MKVVKLYALTWIIFAAAALSAYTTSSLSPIKLIIFGFFGATLIVMGLTAGFSYLLNSQYESKLSNPEIKKNEKGFY